MIMFNYLNSFWFSRVKYKYYILWSVFILTILTNSIPLILNWEFEFHTTHVPDIIDNSVIFKMVSMILTGLSLPLLTEVCLDFIGQKVAILEMIETIGNVFYIGIVPAIIVLLSVTSSLTVESFWYLWGLQRVFQFFILFCNIVTVESTSYLVSDIQLLMLYVLSLLAGVVYGYYSYFKSPSLYDMSIFLLAMQIVLQVVTSLMWIFALFRVKQKEKWRHFTFPEFKTLTLLIGYLIYWVGSIIIINAYDALSDDSNTSEGYLSVFSGILIIHGLFVTIIPGREARRLVEKERETLTIKREFVKSISNEITSPLYVSHVSLEVLKAQLQSDREINLEKVIDQVGNIYYSNETALSIMNDLLQYENIDTGTFQLNSKIILLKNIFKGRFIPLFYIAQKYLVKLLIFDQIGTSEYYKLDSEMNNNNNEYNNNLFNAIGSHLDNANQYSLVVDIITIDQMLRNLLYTMVKNTPSGGTISIHFKIIKIIEKSIEKNYLSIELIYMSIINENDENNENEEIKDFNVIIFNPNKPSTNGSDTGMDLWIAKKIIEAHNGTFDFSCDLNRRNPKFIVNLPLLWSNDDNNSINNNLNKDLDVSISQSMLINNNNINNDFSSDSKSLNEIKQKNNSYSNSSNYNKVHCVEENNDIDFKKDASKIIQYETGILDMINEIYIDNNSISDNNNNNNNNNNQQIHITPVVNLKETIQDNNNNLGFHIYSKSVSFFPIQKIPPRININNNIKSNEFFEVVFFESGSCSDVFTAIYQEKQVIVKMLKREFVSSESARKQFQTESEILIRCNHNNIINIYGIGVDPRPFIILEYLQGGTLDDKLLYLSNINEDNNKTNKYDHQKLIIEYSLTIAKTMKYLHSETYEGLTIIHRDLKPGFTSDGIIKIFDFGLASTVFNKQNQSDVYQLTGFTGSIRYMAPEVALKKPYSEKVDVYSFGVLLWQMMTLQKPYSYVNNNVVYGRVVLNGERPIITSDFPIYLKDLLTKCWDKDYNSRPDFNSIVHTLEEIIYVLKKQE